MTTLVRETFSMSFTLAILTEPSVATLNPATMEALQLFRGDTIIVRCVDCADDPNDLLLTS